MSTTKEKTIFCIDDDYHHNEILENYLKQRYPFKVVTFTSGEEALAQLDTQKPTVIILDYYLDKTNHTAKNGLEILKMVKEKNPEIFVIILSGQEKIEIAVDTLKHGAFDYVVKSETAFVRLQKIISAIFHYKKMEKELNWYMERM